MLLLAIPFLVSAQRIAAAPSVLDAVSALHEALIDLDGLLQVVLMCADRLENWESIGLEEMEEASPAPSIATPKLTLPQFTHMNSDGLDRLDVPHRRLVALHKTETARDAAIRESLNLLSTFILVYGYFR